jgi:hypothetical protein
MEFTSGDLEEMNASVVHQAPERPNGPTGKQDKL